MDSVQENNKPMLALTFSGILLRVLRETWYNLRVSTCKLVPHISQHLRKRQIRVI